MAHASILTTLKSLRERYPNAKFLALGQTVFWDEPMKAVWRRHLDSYWPQAWMFAGVHDTDYFAKTTAHVRDDQKFIALPHDDGRTRGLWSAAGELSALLGSEDLPARSFFESLGIPFDRLAADSPEGRAEFYAEQTEAWGWRGIVQTSGAPLIAHDVPLSDFKPALLETLDWGFAQSLALLTGEARVRAEELCRQIRHWVELASKTKSAEPTLTSLYTSLLPRFYQLLLKTPPKNLLITQSATLFRLNRGTCRRPLFRFVDIFLNPKTRQTACDAYDAAVSGGGMYALASFGADALPFDVVIPGRGRGTLYVRPTELQIDFAPEPARLPLTAPVESIFDLASVLENAFGSETALVGKAVALVSMIAGEFVIVFHETASGYTDRTLAMNEKIRAEGIDLILHPIVRLAYSTWDALGVVGDVELALPPHLARTFGAAGRPVTASEFARRWSSVVGEQKAELSRLRELRRTRDLLTYLDARDRSQCWSCDCAEYEKSIGFLTQNSAGLSDLRKHRDELRTELKNIKSERSALEREKGEDFRGNLTPKKSEQERQSAYDLPIAALAARARQAKHDLKALRRQMRAAERTDEALKAREVLRQVVRESQTAKMRLARAGYLTVEGLPHTNLRPTAWWLPLVDSSGQWFDAVAETAQARLEIV